jgi:hypothetical protein
MDKDLPDVYMSETILDTLREYSDKYSEDMKGALSGFDDAVLGILQVATDGEDSVFTKAE